MDERPAQIIYELKLYRGIVSPINDSISEEDMARLDVVYVLERYEDKDEALNVLDEYRSLAEASDENNVLINAYGIEEMDFKGEEYISTNRITFAPFDESGFMGGK